MTLKMKYLTCLEVLIAHFGEPWSTGEMASVHIVIKSPLRVCMRSNGVFDLRAHDPDVPRRLHGTNPRRLLGVSSGQCAPG